MCAVLCVCVLLRGDDATKPCPINLWFNTVLSTRMHAHKMLRDCAGQCEILDFPLYRCAL